MNVDAIKNGIVIDHITAGRAMQLYHFLGLDRLDCSVAIIKNAASKKCGRKDVIKIDEALPVDLDVIGYIDPGATINIIKDGKLSEKCHLNLPTTIMGVIECKNPRCITTTEQEIVHNFKLTDADTRTYRCVYCESKAK